GPLKRPETVETCVRKVMELIGRRFVAPGLRMSLREVMRKDPVWVSAGSLWQDSSVLALTASSGGSGKQIVCPRSRTRAASVAYIVSEDASVPHSEENLFRNSGMVSALFCILANSEYYRESLRHEIRMARERFSGKALSEELNHIQSRLDSIDLLTPDIVMNLLLRNHPGDRVNALKLILPVVESADKVASDLYCLCGRIYKDMFMSSGFTDVSSRDQACFWYIQFACLCIWSYSDASQYIRISVKN
ncbi:hypothetical protein XENOCAPTIV_000151, partial [Xenoophorus captivus]